MCIATGDWREDGVLRGWRGREDHCYCCDDRWETSTSRYITSGYRRCEIKSETASVSFEGGW